MSQASSYGPPPDQPVSPPQPRKVRKQPPQKTVDDFWKAFNTEYPGKVLSLLPKDYYAKSKAAKQLKGTVVGHPVLKSYDEAKAECEAAVQQIARECKRVNMRYRDKHFDIEFDLKDRQRRCLDGIWGHLSSSSDSPTPRSVKRVSQIFKAPQFYIDNATAADVRQGKTGDCYLLAAVGALGGNPDNLIKKVCVARDEKVGVYGFVFHRDGEWIHTVVDDKLYLSIADYSESLVEKSNWAEIMNRQDAETEYREAFQTGSRALYFAQCNNENETWLPLLEKAYAKAHGDYDAIIGGFTGEAIEDLTGGVTTELFGTDILDLDQFWEKELSRVNEEFLFGCATGLFDEWQTGYSSAYREGIQAFHAYTIMKAATYKGERLLLVRNPWGQTEWKGRWSDGSPQWDGESLSALNHKFGDDGVFWISYEDLLRNYQFFDRTRLFDSSWKVSQQWTTVDVPWSADYNETKFTVTVTEESTVVIVLSQLDSRYWTGLEGSYDFNLHFRLNKEGDESFAVRSHGNYWMTRSVSTELDLEPGTYTVLMKITATKNDQQPVEEVVREIAKTNREKLLQYGLAYDLAHAKGIIVQTEEEKRLKAEIEEKRKEEAKRKAKQEAKKLKYRKWVLKKKEIERTRREKSRKEEHNRKKKTAKASESGSVIGEQEGIHSKLGHAGVVEDVSIEKPPVISEPTAPKPDVEPAKADGPAESQYQAAGAPQSETSDGSRIADDTVFVPRESENTTVKSPEDEKEPLVKNPGPVVPALKVNDGNNENRPLLTPPVSPGFPPSIGHGPEDDAETVVSYDSSIDSDLDLDLPSDGDSASDEDENDPANEEFSNDPWNAVCVVGLRVYSKGEGDITVGVIRPKIGEGGDAPLDVDDPSKGMSDEPTSPISPAKETTIVETLESVIASIPAS